MDLVVLGSRDLGAAKRVLLPLVGLGSVSDYLVHKLHCAVAVVKGEHRDDAGEAPAGTVS